MNPVNSASVIKNVQKFMDGLDKHVLTQKLFKSNVEVRHVAFAVTLFAAAKMMGDMETNLEYMPSLAKLPLYAGGTIGMMSEKRVGVSDRKDRTTLNALVNAATRFMVAQTESGIKIKDDDKYHSTLINRYNEDGKVVDQVYAYQYREALKAKAGGAIKETVKAAKGIAKMFSKKKMQNS